VDPLGARIPRCDHSPCRSGWSRSYRRYDVGMGLASIQYFRRNRRSGSASSRHRLNPSRLRSRSDLWLESRRWQQ
jgi:hypothetical protein